MFDIDNIKWSVLDYIWSIPFKVSSVPSIASKASNLLKQMKQKINYSNAFSI